MSKVNPNALDANPAFSDVERDLLADTDFFRLKQAIEAKVLGQLNALQAHMQPKVQELQPLWPHFVDWQRGKISRGSQYKGLPYWVLDYPSGFAAENWCTLRTLCLWGHGYGQHILLKGLPLAHCKPKLIQKQAKLASQGWKLHTGADIWQWENADAFLAEISTFRSEAWHAEIYGSNVLKLSRFWTFAQFELMKSQTVDGLEWLVGDSISD